MPDTLRLRVPAVGGAYPPEVTVPLLPPAAPPAFAQGLRRLETVLGRGGLPAGLVLRAVPAPKRMAPWATAVAADVTRDEQDVASGRFVVLHDPDGQDGWDGDTRVVALVEAQVEAEMAADPMLALVGWSWLTDALEQRQAAYAVAGGTVTRTVSSRFGELAGQPASPSAGQPAQPDDSSEVEIRASWTVLPGPDGLDLGRHLSAWCDLLCATAGLPPPGVAALHR